LKIAQINEVQQSPNRFLSRDSLLCVCLLAICLLLTWPVAEIGINDDCSYILTAWNYGRSGHLVYNGWATAILGWQPMLGGLMSRMFGQTFSVVRLSLIPISLCTALLFHAVLGRFGANRSHTRFGTLVFILSPLFIPLSDTFMTDVSGMFAVLICIYLCQLAASAATSQKAIFWIVTASITNVALGTVRQIVWLGVLIIVPSCGLLLRKRPHVLMAACVSWCFGAGSIAVLLHWANNQPYFLPETLLPVHINLHAIFLA
jgi:hypothetical protein